MEIAGLVAFLKFCLWGSVGTVVTASVIDMGRAGMLAPIFERWKNKLIPLNAIPLDNEHTTIIGLTQHGKTYATMHTLKRLKEGVFFFNAQHEKTPSGFVTANKNTPFMAVVKALKQGKKINYIPSDNMNEMSKELGAIVNGFYTIGQMDIRVAIDEVHLLNLAKDKAGKDACIRLATTGLRWGYKSIFMSQRPAMVDNTLYTQSTLHIIFALGKNDEGYLKGYHFPVEEITSKTKNEKYRFVMYDQKTVKGPYMIRG